MSAGMPGPEELESRLAEARRNNNVDALAKALTEHADVLVRAGQLDRARAELDEAAAIHRAKGRVYDEARCTHLAATLARLTGDLDGAQQRAEHALKLAEPGTPIAVSALTELAEIASARRDGATAAELYGKALEQGRTAGLIPSAQSALLRKRAGALSTVSRFTEAAADLASARQLLLEAHDDATALRTAIELATALQYAGDGLRSEQVQREAMEQARATSDHHALADLFLLEAARKVAARDVDGALAAARSARAESLEAVAPVSYISAALAISELANSRADHLGAYETLASGWATLSDVMGREAAKEVFEPKLRALREQWGADEFARVKQAYELQRSQKRSERN
jgi:hypothetical protein